jgi:hypothetical protein
MRDRRRSQRSRPASDTGAGPLPAGRNPMCPKCNGRTTARGRTSRSRIERRRSDPRDTRFPRGRESRAYRRTQGTPVRARRHHPTRWGSRIRRCNREWRPQDPSRSRAPSRGRSPGPSQSLEHATYQARVPNFGDPRRRLAFGDRRLLFGGGTVSPVRLDRARQLPFGRGRSARGHRGEPKRTEPSASVQIPGTRRATSGSPGRDATLGDDIEVTPWHTTAHANHRQCREHPFPLGGTDDATITGP